MINFIDVMKAKLQFEGKQNALAMTNEQWIADYINEDQKSLTKRDMLVGNNYYYNKADIIRKSRYIIKEGQKVIDGNAKNNISQNNFHQLLVDQKADYLLGKPVTFSSEDTVYLAKIKEILDEEFDSELHTTAKYTSNKGVEYWQIYINEKGEFKYKIIDSLEIIPIYQNLDKKTLKAVVRYYEIIGQDEKKELQIEYWDDEKVTYFTKPENGGIVFDVSREVNPEAHFYYSNGINGMQPYGWGRVPFIEFRNNDEKLGDLPPYKSQIDDYNTLRSETQDNLCDIQQVAYIIKNYMGADAEEFTTNLKNNKIVLVGADGGVEPLHVEIPIDAVERTLDRIEADIFKFGRGVNMKTDIFKTAPSGIALRQLYQGLDQKCSGLERKFKRALKDLIQFIDQYLLIITGVDYSDIDVNVVFNKSMLVNEFEKIEMIEKSGGVKLSQKTLLAAHPFVDDVEQELAQLEEEKEPVPVTPEPVIDTQKMVDMMNNTDGVE